MSKFDKKQTVSEFELLIENFQRNKIVSESENVIGEISIYNRLIVMDDVSGFADKSNDFGSFLTVAIRFNITVMSFTLCILQNRIGK